MYSWLITYYEGEHQFYKLCTRIVESYTAQGALEESGLDKSAIAKVERVA